MRWMIVCIALLGVVSIGGAQQLMTLTVEQAVQIALDNSKSLHSSLMGVDYADAKAGEVGAARLPAFAFGGSYTRLSDVPAYVVSLPLPPPAPTTFTLSPTIVNNYNLRLSVQQPVFTGFKLDAASAVAENSVGAATQSYARERSELVFNVKNSYWNLYKAIEFKKVIDENVGQIQAHVADVQKLMDQGMATNNDVLKVQVQLSDAQLRQIDAANGVRLAAIGLNNTLGLPLATGVELKTALPYQPRTFSDLDGLIQQALGQRADVKAMEFQVKAGEAGVTVAQSGWYPQVYLVGDYYYARPNQRILPTQDLFKDTWDVGVSVSLNIWNWGTTVHQTDQAEAQLQQAKDARSLLADGVALEVTRNYLNLNQAKERISVAQKEVEQAEENYRITDERFKEGLALNSDLLDAEVALLQAHTNYTQAQVDFEVAEASLEQAIGE